MSMQQVSIRHSPNQTAQSWAQAYKAFLLNRHESLILKIAPLLILFGTPEILASNLIPFVGEFADLGELSIIIIVIVKTYAAVRKYRTTTYP